MKENIITTVGKRIKKERIDLRMSQKDLADKLGIANQTVNGWEGGRRLPDLHMLTLLSDIFNCSIDYLAGKTDNRKAAVIEENIDGKNLKIEIDSKYFATLSPVDIKNVLKEIQNAGFDIKKLI